MTNSRKKIGQLTIRPFVRNGEPTGQWCLDVPATLGGQRKRMLFENRRKAEEVAREVNRRVAIAGIPVPQPSSARLTFRELSELWAQKEQLRVGAGNKKRSSSVADLYRLKTLLAYFGDQRVSSIEETKILEYQAYRRRQGRRPATINSEVGTLKHVLKEGRKRGAISSLPEVERIRQSTRSVPIPTETEVARLIEAAPPRLRVLLAFLAETGCRRGEALHLTWEALDLDAGFARIEPKNGWSPKTAASQRRVPLSTGLGAALSALPRTGPYVFPARSPGKPLSDFKRALATTVRRAGLVRNGELMRITPHVLRKANASWLAARRVHPRVLQTLLGHSPGSRMTDQHYVHASDETLREASITLPVWPDALPTHIGKIRQHAPKRA